MNSPPAQSNTPQSAHRIPSDPDELSKLITRSVQAGLPGFAAVCRAMKFFQEGRTLQKPFQRAQRFALAWETVNRALEYGDSRAEARQLREQLAKRGEALLTQTIEQVHASFQQQIKDCSNRTQQIQITRQSIDELWKFHQHLQDRLEGFSQWRRVLRECIEFWKAQYELLQH